MRVHVRVKERGEAYLCRQHSIVFHFKEKEVEMRELQVWTGFMGVGAGLWGNGDWMVLGTPGSWGRGSRLRPDCEESESPSEVL